MPRIGAISELALKTNRSREELLPAFKASCNAAGNYHPTEDDAKKWADAAYQRWLKRYEPITTT